MKHYLEILFQVLPWYIKGILVDKFKLSKPLTLPLHIGKFRLVKNITTQISPFGIGVYKTTKGRSVIIKIWQKEEKDIHYFNLIHQIEIMEVITAVQKRILKKEKYGFSIPNYITSIIEKNRVVLIMERVNGKTLESIKDEHRLLQIYEKCLSFLKALSSHLTPREKKKITTRSASDFLFLYPLTLSAAIALQPKHRSLLLRGVSAFLRGIPSLFSMKANRLVHGDISTDNILKVGKYKFSLIDVENMRLSYPLYEPVTSIALKRNPSKFKQLIIESILVPKTKISKARRALQALLINNSTYNLSGDTNKTAVISYLKAFNLAFNLEKYE